MDGKVIDALFGLFNQGVAVHIPTQFADVAANFFKSLINRNCANRHGRIANDRFAGQVDVGTGGKIHNRVGAPTCGP